MHGTAPIDNLQPLGMARLVASQYILHYCVGTKILFVWPHDAMMCRANLAKIRLVRKLFECTTAQIGFHIKNARNPATCEDLNLEVSKGNGFRDFVHCWLHSISTDQS